MAAFLGIHFQGCQGDNQNTSKNTQEKLEATIKAWMQTRSAPGIAIAIVQEDQLVYANGFGVKNIATGELVTPSSIFHLASNSKPFVATAIMKLAEQKKVNLDSLVIRYLPYFQMKDKRHKQITVKQLLNHTSGVPDTNDYGWTSPEYDDRALEKYVRSLKDLKLLATPGDSFSYSNIAYEILGDLIAKVSGKSFESYLKLQVLNPLNMKHSTFLKHEVPSHLSISPHVRKLKPVVSNIYPYNRAHAPSSTLHSNVLEMSNWIIMNMNQGLYQDRRILNYGTHQKLLTETVKIGWSSPFDEGFGLSWFLGSYKGYKTVSHKGRDTGFGSMVVFLPERRIGVVVLGNADFAPIGQIAEAILDIMLDLPSSPPRSSIYYPISQAVADKGLMPAIEEYHALKTSQFNSYYFDERQLNDLGYELLEMERLQEAIEIFKLNVREYPGAANVYDSLGEAYMKNGEKELAIKNYEKSLELNANNNNAVKMLRLLNQE